MSSEVLGKLPFTLPQSQTGTLSIEANQHNKTDALVIVETAFNPQSYLQTMRLPGLLINPEIAASSVYTNPTLAAPAKKYMQIMLSL